MNKLVLSISFAFLLSCSSDGTSPNNNNPSINQSQLDAIENYSVFEEAMSEKLYPSPDSGDYNDRQKRILEALAPCEVIWEAGDAKLGGEDCPAELNYTSKMKGDTILLKQTFLSKSDRLSGLLGLSDSNWNKRNTYTEGENNSVRLVDELVFTATLLNQEQVEIKIFNQAVQQNRNIYIDAILNLNFKTEPQNSLSVYVKLKATIINEEDIRIDEMQCLLNNLTYSCEKLEEIIGGFSSEEKLVKSAKSLQSSNR